MTASLILTGSGTVGEIQTWSVTEEITPVSVGDSSGSTGSVSITVAQGEDSEFVVDNLSTFTESALGSISGKVGQLSSSGATEATDTSLPLQLTTPISTLARDVDAQLVADVYAYDLEAGVEDLPFTPFGSNYSRIRLTHNSDGSTTYIYQSSATELSITNIVNGVATTYLTGITGSDLIVRGFVSDSSLNYYVATQVSSVPKIFKISSIGALITSVGASGTGNGQYGAWDLNAVNAIAIDDTFTYLLVADTANNRVQTLLTSTLAYSSQFAVLSPLVLTSANNYVYVMRYATDNSAIRVFTLAGTSTGNATISGIQSLAGFVPIALEISKNSTSITEYRKLIIVGRGTGVGYIGATMTGNFSRIVPDNLLNLQPVVDANKFLVVNTPLYDGSLGSTYLRTITDPTTNDSGAVKKFISDATTIAGLLSYYLALGKVNRFKYSASQNPKITAIPWSGSLWTKIKDLLSAYEIELAVVDNVPTVRDIGINVMTLDNVLAGTANLTLDSRASATELNIKSYDNSSALFSAYDARIAQGSFSVGVGTVSTYTLVTDSYTLYPLSFDYYVEDSAGIMVTLPTFGAAGGDLTAYVTRDNPKAINLIFTGPSSVIAGTTAPYSLTVNKSPYLIIKAYGLYTSPVQYTLPTGGDPEKTGSKNTKDIDNIFINNVSRMYDAANRFSADAAGSKATLEFSLPTSEVSKFGLSIGSLVSMKEAVYRITSATIGKSKTDFSADNYTTTGAFDANVSGKTTGDFDTFWSGNDTQDVKIKPLRPIA